MAMISHGMDTGLSSSFVVHENVESLIESGDKPQGELDRKATWGLFCVYMAIGTVGDFFVTFLAAPTICQYVFGPMGEGPGFNTTLAQCNVAPTVFQISWNFKLFFGFFLDLVPFFGSRRRGWILFGWTGGLAMLAFNAIFVQSFIDNHQFDLYLYSLMAMCFMYCFSDVAADGMVVEMSKFEPADRKGHLLTTCQMSRFLMMMISTVLGTLVMSGPSYQPKPIPADALALPFELSPGGVHWMLFAVAMPFYIGMWLWVRDPPVSEEHHSTICEGARVNGGKVWTALKSFAVFMLIIQCYGNQALASLMNPGLNSIASISRPTSIQNGLGAIIQNLCFLGGMWIFRKWFMGKSWRMTLFMSQFFLALANGSLLLSIYDVGGISRNGWFYMFAANVPSMIQGIGRVVSSLPVIEISPTGLEATVFELLTSANNGAMSMNSALQTLLGGPFKLADVNAENFFGKAHADKVPEYEERLMLATVTAILINVVAAAIFMFFLPRNAEHCKAWASKQSWHKSWAAVLNVVIFTLPFVYANYTTVSHIAG